MRPIDADRLLFHSCNDMKGKCRYWGSGNCYTCQKALITKADIDNAPTVLHDNYSEGYQDGVKKVLSERPHGEWIKEEDRVHSKCSLCGFKYADYGILFDYCPNCGADMRGGRE